MFIAAQILGGLSIAILLGYSVLKVSRKVILVCNMLINLLWAAHYFLLGANTGALCSLLCVAMTFVFYFKDTVKWLGKLYVPILFGVAFAVFGIVTWENWFSIIPVVGNILLVIAMWLDKEIVIKATCIPVAALWVVYNSIYFSYIGAIGQSLSFVAHVFYVAKYYLKKKKN